MGRKVVSRYEFDHALELLRKSRDQLSLLIREQLDFMDVYRRFMYHLATALSWVKTLDFWIDQLKKEVQK